MMKKESEALREEIAKLREKVEALEKEPRKYEFHYHPPLFVNIPSVFPASPPLLPWQPWATTSGSPLPGAPITINRLEASCVN